MARSGAAIGTIRVPAVLLGCVNTSERCTTLCTNPGGKSQRRCGQCPGLCTPHCQPAGPESVGSPQPCTCCSCCNCHDKSSVLRSRSTRSHSKPSSSPWRAPVQKAAAQRLASRAPPGARLSTSTAVAMMWRAVAAVNALRCAAVCAGLSMASIGFASNAMARSRTARFIAELSAWYAFCALRGAALCTVLSMLRTSSMRSRSRRLSPMCGLMYSLTASS